MKHFILLFFLVTLQAQELCFICRKPLYTAEQPVLSLPCTKDHKHRWHYRCVEPWLAEHRTCPYCRTGVEAPSEFLRQQLEEAQRKERYATAINEFLWRAIVKSNQEKTKKSTPEAKKWYTVDMCLATFLGFSVTISGTATALILYYL